MLPCTHVIADACKQSWCLKNYCLPATNVPCSDLALRPLAPGVHSMTVLQHLEQHRSLAMQLGIKLHQLNLEGADTRTIMDGIKQLLDRWVCMRRAACCLPAKCAGKSV